MKCFCAGRVPGRECRGRITDHHIVSRDRLHRHFRVPKKGPKPAWFAAIIADPRNLVDACFDCHLGLLETGNPLAQVQLADLPAGFFDFIAQHGLQGAVPRHLAAHVQEAA